MGTDKLPELNRYEIVGILGQGSMGTVYKARHKLLGREVALKVPQREMLRNSTSVERFLREGRALAMLQHPHVVGIFDADIENNLPFIAMEFIDGGTLRAQINHHRKLPVKQVIQWAIELAKALDYIHARGILHRDLKSSNILITSENKALLTDFGIAYVDAQATITHGLLGTPAYMSPEQARGEELDGRSDMYSLGVVLYESLTGMIPFEQDNGLAIIQRIIHDAPDPVETYRPDVPPGLSKIIHRCLEKKPDRRYQSGAQLARALEEVDVAAPVESSKKKVFQTFLEKNFPSTYPEALPDVLKNHTVITFAAIVLVALLALLIFMTPLGPSNSPEASSADSTKTQWQPWPSN